MATGADLARHAGDHVGHVVRQQPQLPVGDRGGFLDGSQRLDEHGELAQRDAGDGEVLERPQRLDSIQRFERDVPRAQQVVLRAGPVAAEAERPPAAHEGGVGAAETVGDGARRTGHQCSIELRRFAGDLLEPGLGEQHGLPGHDDPRGGAMGAVVEEQALAHGFTGAKGDQPGGATIGGLFDGDRALDQDGEALARLALAEDQRVCFEGRRGHMARQLPEMGIGEPLKKGGAAEAVGDFGGRGHEEG